MGGPGDPSRELNFADDPPPCTRVVRVDNPDTL